MTTHEPFAADRKWMARALELAARGEGRVEPNPMVGCVLVSPAGEMIGEGWHTEFGRPHAEIEALQMAGPKARGASMYVTLEPCCHHGKTPPCSDAVVAAGLRRVVVALRDPFPQVDGGASQRSRRRASKSKSECSKKRPGGSMLPISNCFAVAAPG